MFCETITYTDFDGNEQKEEVRLNLTKIECKELDLKYEEEGGIFEHLRSLLKRKKGDEIPQRPMYEFLNEIIAQAYGVKSEDGRRFIKTKPDGTRLSYEFMDSACYARMIEMLLTEEMDIEKFILAIFPEIPEKDRKEAEATARKELGL